MAALETVSTTLVSYNGYITTQPYSSIILTRLRQQSDVCTPGFLKVTLEQVEPISITSIKPGVFTAQCCIKIGDMLAEIAASRLSHNLNSDS